MSGIDGLCASLAQRSADAESRSCAGASEIVSAMPICLDRVGISQHERESTPRCYIALRKRLDQVGPKTGIHYCSRLRTCARRGCRAVLSRLGLRILL